MTGDYDAIRDGRDATSPRAPLCDGDVPPEHWAGALRRLRAAPIVDEEPDGEESEPIL